MMARSHNVQKWWATLQFGMPNRKDRNMIFGHADFEGVRASNIILISQVFTTPFSSFIFGNPCSLTYKNID